MFRDWLLFTQASLPLASIAAASSFRFFFTPWIFSCLLSISIHKASAAHKTHSETNSRQFFSSWGALISVLVHELVRSFCLRICRANSNVAKVIDSVAAPMLSDRPLFSNILYCTRNTWKIQTGAWSWIITSSNEYLAEHLTILCEAPVFRRTSVENHGSSPPLTLLQRTLNV